MRWGNRQRFWSVEWWAYCWNSKKKEERIKYDLVDTGRSVENSVEPSLVYGSEAWAYRNRMLKKLKQARRIF